MEIQTTLRAWAVDYGAARDAFLPLFGGFFASEAVERRTLHVLGHLSTSCSLTSDSAAHLLQFDRLWDADILLRSVYEGTLKFVFLCSPDQSERIRRVEEYWNILPEIARIRRSERAADLLALVSDPESPEWKAIRDLVLRNGELEGLRRRFPRKERQSIAQRWSFAQLVAHAHEFPAARDLAGLTYMYGMASHTVHQDGDAVAMISEREGRPEPRRAAIKLAHAARQISDLVMFAWLRAATANWMAGLPMSPVVEALKQRQALFDELAEAQRIFHSVEYGA